MNIGTFPWGSVESTTRAHVAAVRQARRWAAQHVRLDALGHALSDLIGEEVRVLVRGTANRTGKAPVRGIELLFARDAERDQTAGASLEVESALALAVVSRAIRRPAPVVVHDEPISAGHIAGAFAAVVMAAARRAHAGTPPCVLFAGGNETSVSARLRSGTESCSLSLTVLVGDDAFSARLTVACDPTGSVLPTVWTRRSLASLGATPLSLPIVACATQASLGEVAAIREGDAWLAGPWRLKGQMGTPSLRGTVLLAAPFSVTGVRATLVEDDRLVLSGEVDSVCAGGNDEMSESDSDDALLREVGDVLVVVRVELGEARMTAREWAALGRGDVVTLGRKVGEPVVLRVGGVPVARGELVNSGLGEEATAGPSLVADAGGRSSAVSRWTGSYRSDESTIEVPKDVKWRVPDSTAGIGGGTITLTRDVSTGRLRGTLDGVLGPASLNGLASGASLTATVVRQDPSDRGFVGTLTGEADEAGAHGTIHVALGEASAVRRATFVLVATTVP